MKPAFTLIDLLVVIVVITIVAVVLLSIRAGRPPPTNTP